MSAVPPAFRPPPTRLPPASCLLRLPPPAPPPPPELNCKLLIAVVPAGPQLVPSGPQPQRISGDIPDGMPERMSE